MYMQEASPLCISFDKPMGNIFAVFNKSYVNSKLFTMLCSVHTGFLYSCYIKHFHLLMDSLHNFQAISENVKQPTQTGNHFNLWDFWKTMLHILHVARPGDTIVFVVTATQGKPPTILEL